MHAAEIHPLRHIAQKFGAVSYVCQRHTNNGHVVQPFVAPYRLIQTLLFGSCTFYPLAAAPVGFILGLHAP